MTTLHTSAGASLRRTPSLATLVGAVAAAAILVIASVWPAGGEGTSVLSAASADATKTPPIRAAAPSARPQASTIVEAEGIYVGNPSTPDEQPPTF